MSGERLRDGVNELLWVIHMQVASLKAHMDAGNYGAANDLIDHMLHCTRSLDDDPE